MVKVLLDTNILIDYLNGVELARDALTRFDNPAISIITWMDVMVGTNDQNSAAVEGFLATFDIIHIDAKIAKQATILRKEHKIKLPDAIIWASAQSTGRLLVTRNTKDFASDEIGVVVPYVL